jgi:pimeloyl-ACP methyl ester carboxylesterase
MRLGLIAIPTPTHSLDGLLYQPSDGTTRGAVLIFHGNCMNFYSGPARFLAQPLAAAGYAVLAFNRRGHDVLHTHGRGFAGGACQTAAEMIQDNDLAATWLAERGFPAPVVIGHSNGGMLAVAHVARRPETPATVLLSAHRGGAGLAAMISARGLFGGERFADLTTEAEAMVAAGDGGRLMSIPGWWHVTTAATFLDFSRNLPDILELAPDICCPTLFVRGDQEAPAIYPAEEFASRTAGPCEVEIVPDCDHFYSGREQKVADLVVGWLARNHAQLRTVASAG